MATLRDERNAFEKLLPSLLQKHRGEFVIMAGGKPLGFHGSFAMAYGAAVRELGVSTRFLVTEVEPEEPQPVSLSWSTLD